MTFVDLFYKHKAGLSDIDNYIDDWHGSDSPLRIYEYLGLSKDEYNLYLQDYFKFKAQMLFRRSEIEEQSTIYYPSEEDAPMRKIPCLCRKAMASLSYDDIDFEGFRIKDTPIWTCAKCGRKYFIEKVIRQAIVHKKERLNKKHNE